MARYVVFVRGINVGRNAQLDMADLREALAGLGYSDIRTHLRSGNAVLTAGARPATVERAIEGAIRERVGLAVRVVLRTKDELAEIVAANTLPAQEGARLHVYFLDRTVTAARFRDIDPSEFAPERFQLGDRVLYVYTPNGFAGSPLVKALGRCLRDVTVTARNWNTATKLLTLA